MDRAAWLRTLFVALVALVLGVDAHQSRAETSQPALPALPLAPAGSKRTATTAQIQEARRVAVDRPDRLSALAPPSFATTPRGFGPTYFERSSYAGPSRRGRAYDVRRRFDG